MRLFIKRILGPAVQPLRDGQVITAGDAQNQSGQGLEEGAPTKEEVPGTSKQVASTKRQRRFGKLINLKELGNGLPK